MTKMRNITKLAFAVSTSLLAANVTAAGFQIVEHSASGLGRAFAGEAAIADNASVIARNPAAMTLLDSASFSGGLSYVDPSVEVDFTSENVKESNAGPTALIPNIYYTRPINEKLNYGVGIFVGFGLSSDYSDEVNQTAAGEIAGDTAISAVYFSNNLSFDITEQVTIGGGLNLVHVEAELNRYDYDMKEKSTCTGLQKPSCITGLPANENKAASMSGEGYGFGWNLSALYQLNENHRWGISYTDTAEMTLEGKFSGVQNKAASGLPDLHYVKDVDGELVLDLPSVLEISGFHQLNEQFAVHYSWVRTGWSSFTEILGTSKNNECSVDGSNDNECIQKDEDWKDADRYSLGATYTPNKNWAFRAGYALDKSPVTEHKTASIPDSDRVWYSGGLTYATGNHAVDFGMTYLIGEDVKATESTNLGSVDFETKSSAMLYALQYSYRFK